MPWYYCADSENCTVLRVRADKLWCLTYDTLLANMYAVNMSNLKIKYMTEWLGLTIFDTIQLHYSSQLCACMQNAWIKIVVLIFFF